MFTLCDAVVFCLLYNIGLAFFCVLNFMGGVLAKCLAEADVSKINTLKDNVFWLEKGIG